MKYDYRRSTFVEIKQANSVSNTLSRLDSQQSTVPKEGCPGPQRIDELLLPLLLPPPARSSDQPVSVVEIAEATSAFD